MESRKPESPSLSARLATPAGLAVLVASGLALGWLLLEHRVHVLALVPYLVLLACPLMHLLHGGHHGQHRHPQGEAAPQPMNPPPGDARDARAAGLPVRRFAPARRREATRTVH